MSLTELNICTMDSSKGYVQVKGTDIAHYRVL